MQALPLRQILIATAAACVTGFLLGLLNAWARTRGGKAMSSDDIALFSTIIAGFAFFISYQMRGNRRSAQVDAGQEQQAKLFQPDPGIAIAYVFRDAFFAKLVGFDIQLDGQPLGQTRGKTFLRVPLAPGQHRLVSKNPQDGSQMDFVWEATAGQIDYIEHALRFGTKGAKHGFALCAEADAQKRVRRCRMLSAPADEIAVRTAA